MGNVRIVEKTADAIINEMINCNMLDFGMELAIVREVIESEIYDAEVSGVTVDYDVNELVEAYSKINQDKRNV